MTAPQIGAFDTATLQMLRTVLDEVWDGLPPQQQAAVLKTNLASHLLRLAQTGQIEPEKLKAKIMSDLRLLARVELTETSRRP